MLLHAEVLGIINLTDGIRSDGDKISFLIKTSHLNNIIVIKFTNLNQNINYLAKNILY